MQPGRVAASGIIATSSVRMPKRRNRHRARPPVRPNRGGRQNFFAQNKSPPRPPLRIGTLSKNSGLVSSETLLRSSIWAISAMSATASTRREGARYGEQPARVPDGVIAEIRISRARRADRVTEAAARAGHAGEGSARCKIILGCSLPCVRTSGCSYCCSCWVASSGSSSHGVRSRRLSSCGAGGHATACRRAA